MLVVCVSVWWCGSVPTCALPRQRTPQWWCGSVPTCTPPTQRTPQCLPALSRCMRASLTFFRAYLARMQEHMYPMLTHISCQICSLTFGAPYARLAVDVFGPTSSATTIFAAIQAWSFVFVEGASVWRTARQRAKRWTGLSTSASAVGADV